MDARFRGLVNADRIGNTQKIMLYSGQIRAARALLGWRQEDLAKAAKIGLATIQRLEKGDGPVMGHVATVMKIQGALEGAGVRFLDYDEAGGLGVRLAHPKKR
jgi:transcriptional regulator with XRE-family HTH domain